MVARDVGHGDRTTDQLRPAQIVRYAFAPVVAGGAHNEDPAVEQSSGSVLERDTAGDDWRA